MNTQIYDEASEWFVEFRAGDVDTAARRRFYSWLRTSPEHMRAYLELAAIWNEGPRLDPARVFDAETLDGAANVIPMMRADAGSVSRGAVGCASGGKTSSARPLALAAMVVFALIAGWILYNRNLAGVYTTDIGEQRSIALADGSNIELNARSKIRVSLGESERHIDLLEGQVLFRVAKDSARPFTVTSDGTTVRAIGTQFDVDRKNTGTTVTVLEGKVAVEQGARSAVETPLALVAGEQAVVTRKAATKAARPNIAAATGWTQRRLIFESAPLAEVADEFNRYNRRRLVIRSPELASFRITGTFSSTDPGSLLRFLEARSDIEVTDAPDSKEIEVSLKQ